MYTYSLTSKTPGLVQSRYVFLGLTDILLSIFLYALVFLLGQVTGRLFVLGYFKVPFFVGTVILIVATVLTGQCREYWSFLFCQGVTVGVRSTDLPSMFVLTIFS
jgi:hypothetical protein